MRDAKAPHSARSLSIESKPLKRSVPRCRIYDVLRQLLSRFCVEREELCWKIIVLITNLSAVQVGCISMESAVLKVRSVRVSRDHAPCNISSVRSWWDALVLYFL